MPLNKTSWLTIVFSGVLLLVTSAEAQTLQPYKDDLFSNAKRKVLEARYNNAFKKYFWNTSQDVNGRDAIAGETAKPERIDLSPLKQQRGVTINYTGGTLDATEVGEPKNAKFAVIFIHGGGGDKSLGINDVGFGGNFNRMKNLATRNNGVYYSPTVEFSEQGGRGVEALINQIKKNSPDAKIVMACGSAGAYTCWQMAKSQEALPKLSGLIFLGGAQTEPEYVNSAAYVSRLPIILSQGNNDKLVDWETVNEEFETIHKANPNYPIRMELYDTGKHGTPIRMLDWKESLQWIFTHSSAAPDSQPATKNSLVK